MPKRVIICRAVAVTFSRSFAAPVVISSKTSSSAARPPSVIAIWSMSAEREVRNRSSVGSETVRPSAWPRLTIEILWTWSQCREVVADERVAHLVVRGDLALVLGEQPRLLLRAGDHAHDALVQLVLADRLAAAPGGEERGLVDEVREVGAREARRAARRACRDRCRCRAACPWCAPRGSCRRPLRSGRSTTIWRSKRPGRSSAGSRMSGRFVAAIRMMLSLIVKPSISTSSWFSVCSRSSWPPPRPAPRWRPTASISSMKMMHGLACLACSKRSRTRRAPTPTNISTKSEPGDGEERDAGLAGDRAGEQRLAGAGRAVEQHALGDARAERLELLRVLQELLDLLELLDRLVHAGDVLERDLRASRAPCASRGSCRSSSPASRRAAPGS